MRRNSNSNSNSISISISISITRRRERGKNAHAKTRAPLLTSSSPHTDGAKAANSFSAAEAPPSLEAANAWNSATRSSENWRDA